MRSRIYRAVFSRLINRRQCIATTLVTAIFALSTVTLLRSILEPPLTSNIQEQFDTGGLNLQKWNVCGFEVDSLRQWPFFPHSPDRQTCLHLDFAIKVNTAIGQRIFGFLTVPQTGKYQFAISSDDESELWLSTDEDPNNIRLIAEVHAKRPAWAKPGELRKYPKQISQQIFLEEERKYFIESLHVNGKGLGHVMVLWKPPGGEEFGTIIRKYLSPYYTGVHICSGEDWNIPSHFKQPPPAPLSEEHVTYYYNTTQFAREHFEESLPVLPYSPSYVQKTFIMKTYEGIWLAYKHMSTVYPEDTVKIIPGSKKFIRFGNEHFPNPVLQREEVTTVVDQCMSQLNIRFGRRFVLNKVIGVEGKEDKKKGVRYFLELSLYDKQVRRHLRLAEYVFRDTDGKLWLPEGLSWKRNATVHFVVPVKNQAIWVKFLVGELNKLYLQTQDENFRLLLIDFESTDDDVAKILENSPLSRKCSLLRKSGPFHKTMALQDAVATVNDPDSIVLLFDLHITVPTSILDSIRKHTIQGRAAFLPIVARLECGASPVKPVGRWELMGSGLVSVYKSDWDMFKGMDVEKYKTKWGGEDWDLLDRILRVGLESERLKIPGFYHYFHSRRGTWDQ